MSHICDISALRVKVPPFLSIVLFIILSIVTVITGVSCINKFSEDKIIVTVDAKVSQMSNKNFVKHIMLISQPF